jgi:hypothetical protein
MSNPDHVHLVVSFETVDDSGQVDEPLWVYVHTDPPDPGAKLTLSLDPVPPFPPPWDGGTVPPRPVVTEFKNIGSYNAEGFIRSANSVSDSTGQGLSTSDKTR